MSELKSPRVQSLADAMSSEGDEPIRTKIQFRWSAGVEQLVEHVVPLPTLTSVCVEQSVRFGSLKYTTSIVHYI